jgi:hypothetical protein
MKYLFFLVLAIACDQALFAQEVEEIDRPAKPYTLTQLYDANYGINKPYARFRFDLAANNSMYIDLDQLKQLDSIPNLDSLFHIIWNDLQQISDSLNDPLVSRRIDGGVSTVARTYRIRQYQQTPQVYQVRNGEILQLKVEQDTIRIQLTTRDSPRHLRPMEITVHPYSVMLLLNHVTDLPGLLDNGTLSKAIAMVKNDIASNPRKKSELDARYRGWYNVVNEKIIQSVRRLSTLDKKFSVELPNYQVGIQYVNGYWTPSLGFGIELLRRSRKLDQLNEQNDEDGFRLIWEPYFFFDRDSAKNFRLSRNDFITFRWRTENKSLYAEKETRFRQTASLGYLIGRRGNYFQQNTFKFSISGLQTKSILLEPEFVFNKFFRNFSPSLKLLYFFGED